MLLTKNVLPNFLKTVLFTVAASMSFSTIADEVNVSELKNTSAEETTILTDDTVKEANEEVLNAEPVLEFEYETEVPVE